MDNFNMPLHRVHQQTFEGLLHVGLWGAVNRSAVLIF